MKASILSFGKSFWRLSVVVLLSVSAAFALNPRALTALTLRTSADLSVSTSCTEVCSIGTEAVYTMTVRHNGGTTLTGFRLFSPPPVGLQNVTYTPSSGTYNATTGDWTGINLAANQSLTLVMRGTVPAGASGSLTHTAQVFPPSGHTDPNASNNSATCVSVIGQNTDLSITKSDNLSTIAPGASTTYYLTIKNNGTTTVPSMRVVDNLPAAIQNASFTPTKGTYDAVTGNWTNLNLAAGESVFLVITGRVSSTAQAGSLINTASVEPPTGFVDTNTSNNTCSDRTDVTGTGGGGGTTGTVDLGIVKTDNRQTIAAGSGVWYQITVTNHGGATVTSMTVRDVLPQYVTATLFTPSAGQYNSSTGLWTGLNLAPGQSVTLTVDGTLAANAPAGTVLTNTASVQPPTGHTDSNPNNNDAIDTTTVEGSTGGTTQQVDLGVTKSDNRTNITPGAQQEWIITVVNNGPATLTNFFLQDTFPPQFDGPITYTASEGTFTAANGQWSGLNFTPGKSLFLTIRGHIRADAVGGWMVNTATVSVPTGFIDTNGNNNTCHDDTYIDGPTGNDIEVVKTVSTQAPTVAEVFTYTIRVTNKGATTANNVNVTDQIPTQLTYIRTVSISQGTFNNTSGTWAVGNLAAGASATLTFEVVANREEQTVQNCALSTYSPDPVAGNNQSCVTVTTRPTQCSCDAGVESNGNNALGLAQRNFNRSTNSEAYKAKIGKTEASIFDEFVPAVGPQNARLVNQSQYVQDLMTYGSTRASVLHAVDYYTTGDRRIAGVFAAKTTGQHYEHTKVTCDRFGTDTLDEVSQVSVLGYPFVVSKIKHNDGKLDYAITFTARKSGSGYIIDSRYTTIEYPVVAQSEDVLTFQIWAVTPQYTADMVAQVLAKLQATANLTFQNNPITPKVFVRRGSYAQGKLVVEIANPNGLSAATLEGQYRRIESNNDATVYTALTRNISLDPTQAVQSIEIDTNGPIYDANFTLKSGDSNDQIYFADGTWSYNVPQGVNVNFETVPHTAYTATDTQWIVERNAKMSGTLSQALPSGSVISMFRALRPANRSIDLSEYNSLTFTATGSGAVEIVPQKEGLEANYQYRTRVDLSATPKTFTIPFNQFANGTGDKLTANDLLWIAFYVLPKSTYPQNFSIDVKDLKLTKSGTETPGDYELYANYPNPFSATTAIKFSIKEAGEVKVAVYDVLGREVRLVANRNFAAGTHTLSFDAEGLPNGTYFYKMIAGDNSLSGKMVVIR